MNPQTILHPLIASSVDPTKVSATVTGFLTAISGGVLLVASLKHIPLTPDQYTVFTQQVGETVFAITTAAGAAYMLFGLVRKAILAIFPSKGPVAPVITAQAIPTTDVQAPVINPTV